jgi:hypothetical protein
MYKLGLFLVAVSVAGCTSTPTALSRKDAEPPSARFDGGVFGGSGNRVDGSTTTAVPDSATTSGKGGTLGSGY